MNYKINCFCGKRDAKPMAKCVYCKNSAHKHCINPGIFICTKCRLRSICNNGDKENCRTCLAKATKEFPLIWIQCHKCANTYHRPCVTYIPDCSDRMLPSPFLCPICYCHCGKVCANKIVKCTKCDQPAHKSCVKGEIFAFEDFLCLKCRKATSFGTTSFTYHCKYAINLLSTIKLKEKNQGNVSL